METTDVKEAGVRRVAVITSICTVADCPIECVCVSSTDPAKKVTCGHYLGAYTNGKGSAVNCGYLGR